MCETKSYPKGYSRGQKPPSTVLSVSYARLYTPRSPAVARHEGNVYATEVRVFDDRINRIQVTAADIVRGQLIFVRGSISRQCEACVQAGGGHLEQLSSPLASPRHTNRKYSHRSTLEWRLKNVTKNFRI